MADPKGLNWGVSVTPLNAVSVIGASNPWATNRLYTSYISWQTIFTGGPSAVNITFEGSLDNSTWAVLDTSTVISGEVRSLYVSVPFLRINLNSKTGGTTFTVKLVANQGYQIGSAPIDATFITQTPSGVLTHEQALNSLADGLLKNTGGVLSKAISGVDYFPPQLKQQVVPVSSDTITITKSKNTLLLVTPAALISPLTINMPDSPDDGDKVYISFGIPGSPATTIVVTSITHSGNGKSLTGPITTGNSTALLGWRYNDSDAQWYRSA